MDEAKIAAAKEYENTLKHTNATLSKFGIQGLSGEALATMDLREMRDYYQSIIDKVQSSPKAVEALEKAIRNLNVEITKEGQKTIIDSLNSELSKLKKRSCKMDNFLMHYNCCFFINFYHCIIFF